MPDAKADSTLARPLAERVGRVVGGRYQIVRLLGRGGTGAVYEAAQLADGAPLAVKVHLPGGAHAELLAEQLRREARAARLLDHPNIIGIRELIEEGDELYLVMELLHGRSVAAELHGGALAARRTLVLARQVLEALAHAHGRGVIHRDLKPDHLFLTQAGAPGREYERVKLIDLGIVALIGPAAAALGLDPGASAPPGVILGTPAYMAPEQALGEPIDGRADLYALGITIFEMLTGRVPFRSPDLTTLVRMQISAPAPPLAQSAGGRPWCTPALEHLVARALAKRPDDRFADAAEMAASLELAFASLDHLPAGT